MSHPVAATAGVYALLADGSTARSGPAAPGDFAAVKAMHEAMSRTTPTCASSVPADGPPSERHAGSPASQAWTTPPCWRCTAQRSSASLATGGSRAAGENGEVAFAVA